jgi:hypothetical protein
MLMPSLIACTDKADLFDAERLYALTVRFHQAFIYPNNLAEANKVNSTLFSENCQGNVDITRTFVGRELNTEYVFGAFARVGKTNSLNLLGVPLSWNMTHWSGYQNTVTCAVTIQMHIPQLNVALPLEIWSWLTFNVGRFVPNIFQYANRMHRKLERSANTTPHSGTSNFISKPS